jgi:hypothetical protein
MLIAAFGIPGSGKSSVVRCLADILGAQAFFEPEEMHWEVAVAKRDVVGRVTAAHWFRSMRVPELFEAKTLSDNGKLVFIDSYYDKLWLSYIGKPGMEWLIDPSDRYFENLRNLAILDRELLPDVDAIILFQVELVDYIRMEPVPNRYYTQKYYIDAAKEYVCRRAGQTKLIEYRNVYSSPELSAARLATIINPYWTAPSH